MPSTKALTRCEQTRSESTAVSALSECSKVQFTEMGNEVEFVRAWLVEVQFGEVKKVCSHVI